MLIAYVEGMFTSEKKNIIEMSLVPIPDIDIGIKLISVIRCVNERT